MASSQCWRIIACWLIAATASAAPESRVPPTVAAYEKSLADFCRQGGGKPAKPRVGFVEHGDLNGDGIDEWAFDEGRYICKGAYSIFSGSGGSQVNLFVGLPNGDAQLVFQHGAYGMRLEGKGKSKRLWLVVGGPMCGQPGSPSHGDSILCDRPLAWNVKEQKFDFAPVSEARIPSRIGDTEGWPVSK